MFSPLICVLSYLYFMSPLPRQENVSTKVANLNPCDVSYSHLKLVSIILGHPVYHKIKMQNILHYKKLSKVTKNTFPIWIIYFLHIFKFLFLWNLFNSREFIYNSKMLPFENTSMHKYFPEAEYIYLSRFSSWWWIHILSKAINLILKISVLHRLSFM